MKKPGNIEYWLGSPFFPDWERTEPTRSVVWTVKLMEGHTATLRIPECPDYAEATEIARRMMPGMHHIAAISRVSLPEYSAKFCGISSPARSVRSRF